MNDLAASSLQDLGEVHYHYRQQQQLRLYRLLPPKLDPHPWQKFPTVVQVMGH
jgi:hypothetical protein